MCVCVCVCVCVCMCVCVVMYSSSNSFHVVLFTNNHVKRMYTYIPAAMAYLLPTHTHTLTLSVFLTLSNYG